MSCIAPAPLYVFRDPFAVSARLEGKSSKELSPNKWMIHKSSPIRRDATPGSPMRNFVSVYILAENDQ